MAPDSTQPPKPPASIEDVLRAYQEIESFLGVDEETIRLPVKVLVAALPQGAISHKVPEEMADLPASVTIKDLFFKLTKGKVTVSVKDVIEALPAQITAGGATVNPTLEVKLPLSAVVAAIDPKALKDKMAAKTHKADLSAIPDPFASLKGALDSVSKQPAPPAAPVPPPAVPPRPAAPAPVAPPPPVPTQFVPPPPAPTQVTPPPAPTQFVPPPPPTAPTPVAPPPAAPAAPVPAPAPVAAPVAPQPAKPRLPPKPKPQLPPEDELDYLEPESLGGVNVNTANAEQLATLPGVTPLVAKAIVEYRDQKGQFRSIFNLIDIPRVGRSTFKKMTGMSYNKNHVHRRRKLALLLGLPASKVGDIPAIAAAIAKAPGLSGCVVSDRDGMLLAESGSTGFSSAMSAVIPRMFRAVNDSMGVVNIGTVDSITLCLDKRMFTVISTDHLNLTVMHEPHKLTRSKVLFVQKAAAELTWVLSHRAYVGKTN